MSKLHIDIIIILGNILSSRTAVARKTHLRNKLNYKQMEKNKMDKFIVNVIHRPEMVPEYSATVTGQGKEEDIEIRSFYHRVTRHLQDTAETCT